MIAKAVYKHGLVSVTEAQEKKHVSQMTKSEIRAIKNKLYSMNISKTRMSRHLTDKLDSGEITIYKKQMVRLLLNFELIEYNKTRGQSRVLLRGLNEEDTIVDGVIKKSNLCIVWNLDTNNIVTAYWNCTNDNHNTIDFRRYNANLKINI